MSFTKISSESKLKIFRIIEECTHLRTKIEFRKELKHLRGLFGYEMAACGLGDVHAMKVICNVNDGFPSDFMSAIIDKQRNIISPLFHQWLQSRKPQVLDFENNSNLSLQYYTEFYRKFAFRNIMSYGVMDFNQQHATYFAFAGMPGKISESHVRLLEILSPHFHVAYMRVVNEQQDQVLNCNVAFSDSASHKKNDLYKVVEILSSREYETLRWLYVGKTNRDIGGILNISENTVKNHVQNIIKKLGANNRRHAVAIAFEKGIIKL